MTFKFALKRLLLSQNVRNCLSSTRAKALAIWGPPKASIIGIANIVRSLQTYRPSKEKRLNLGSLAESLRNHMRYQCAMPHSSLGVWDSDFSPTGHFGLMPEARTTTQVWWYTQPDAPTTSCKCHEFMEIRRTLHKTKSTNWGGYEFHDGSCFALCRSLETNSVKKQMQTNSKHATLKHQE
eukprot:1343295-Amphidinium_carterae.1